MVSALVLSCNGIILFTNFFNSFPMFICIRFPSPNFLGLRLRYP